MVKVVIVNGKPGAGKTTFEYECKYIEAAKMLGGYGNTAVDFYSTVDFVKEIARECGWDGTKTPHNRKFLSDLKDLLTRWDDVPCKKVMEKVNTLCSLGFAKDDWILFVDCREPAEIQKLKEMFNGTTVLVRRLGDEMTETSNHADANVFDYEYDYVVKNYGDLEILHQEADAFLEFLKERDCFEFCN
jgi:KaiC/GvpD/RAD55 family RecA-like ATPase